MILFEKVPLNHKGLTSLHLEIKAVQIKDEVINKDQRDHSKYKQHVKSKRGIRKSISY